MTDVTTPLQLNCESSLNLKIKLDYRATKAEVCTLFAKSSTYYDRIYDACAKDYEVEAKRLHELIQRYKRAAGNVLLDVACGTRRHISFLRQWLAIEGLDLDSKLLSIARRRNHGIVFHRGDMVKFRLQKSFDAITCLFSSIGYVKTLPRLRLAIRNMNRHLRPGGVLIIEPWLTPESFHKGLVHATFVDQPELKIARINRTTVRGRVSIIDFHYLVGAPRKVEHFTEHHELGLFSHSEYLAAFREAGMEVLQDPEGLIGRGLYIGIQPTA